MIPAYALLIFLITGTEVRVVAFEQMRNLDECIEQAMLINTDKQNPFNAACYATKVSGT